MRKYLVLFLAVSFFSCEQNPGSDSGVQTMEFQLTPSQKEQKEEEFTEKKLIKEGRVEFEADDLNDARKTVFAAVQQYDAYVSSDRELNFPGRISNTIIIRVPEYNFDKLLNDATKGIKNFDSKEITIKDVTEEFLDVRARLKAKKELENRYLELLKQAKTVSEMLEIEKQIGELRSEIESVEGRLKYLEDRVSFSVLTLTFYERIPGQTQFGQKFKDGLRNGWNNLLAFFVVLINLWPFILIGFGLFAYLRFYRKRKKPGA